MTFHDQAEFDLRCEWGEQGVHHLAPISDVVIIVDVLSFSTCVEIATSRGGIIYPYPWKDKTAEAFAHEIGAHLAQHRDRAAISEYSLSPQSLMNLPSGTRLVLPSPNGATLSLRTGHTPTLVGSLRNYRAVAAVASQYGRRIAVIPAGERWPDGSLRPAFEDWVAAGAILSQLTGSYSPEATSAIAAYQHVQAQELQQYLSRCSSGKELIGRGFAPDLELAAALDVSQTVPILRDSAYIAQRTDINSSTNF